jgi:NADH dehydrogenase
MSGHRVVIVGGGFGGLNAAHALRRAPVQVTLLDRRNFHLFQPLLYQVATGGLSPADIASPLRSIFKRQANLTVLSAEVRDIDPAGRRVSLEDRELPFDTLILAAGVGHHYFGNDGWARLAPGLKTVEDATEIRGRVLTAFESAESECDPDRRAALLTFVVVGAGPTGVELAGAIGEMAAQTLRRDFKTFDPGMARIVLVEGVERVLPPFPEKLSRAARRSLSRLGVEVRTGTRVQAMDEDGVDLQSGDGLERIPARTILWAAGVRASPLARVLAERAGAVVDRVGRVRVQPDCSVAGHPEIFAIGDMAGRLIGRRLCGQDPPGPFRYKDRGTLAVIGRAAAVADFGRLQFSGYPAWLLWLFVHIMLLVEFENRVLVFVQWAFSYLTRNRGARLITKAWKPDDG